MSQLPQFSSRPTEAVMPVFDLDGPAHVTISSELAMHLAQASSRGIVLYGTFVNQNVVSIGLNGYELESITPNPNVIEDKKYLAYHPTVAEVATVRAEVQRLFVKSKKDNAREYGNYIAAVDKGERLGFAPAPILWSRDLLQVVPLGLSNLCVVVIPRGKMTIPIDGETQVAGRFQAWERDEALREVTFPVLLAHGRTEDWARQTFHDVNVFGIKPNAALAISMDQYDPATQVARSLTTKVPFLQDKVNMTARQLGKAEREAGQITTIAALRTNVVTLNNGIGGVAVGAKGLALDEPATAQLARQAEAWWNALGTELGAVLCDPNAVASAPAGLAALGAVGHRVFERGEDPQAVAARLAREIKWDKGQRWAGIAGKFTPKGVFSLGGAKENAYAIFAALTDPEAPSYAQIRN